MIPPQSGQFLYILSLISSSNPLEQYGHLLYLYSETFLFSFTMFLVIILTFLIIPHVTIDNVYTEMLYFLIIITWREYSITFQLLVEYWFGTKRTRYSFFVK